MDGKTKKAKKTKRKESNAGTKRTVSNESYSSDNEKMVWRFDMIDRSGKFAFDLNRDEFLHKDFIQKMMEYSEMKWSDIKSQTHDKGKSKHHSLEITSLSSDAFKRFKERQMDQYSDQIFSLALNNKLRIIGIREDENFHVVWYDPKHEVCPSKKKHT